MNKSMLEDLKLPRKLGCPKKCIIAEAGVNINGGETLARKLKKKIIHRATELADIVPFDRFMRDGCKQHFVMMFGFDAIEAALAAQARLGSAKCDVCFWIKDDDNQIMGMLEPVSGRSAYRLSCASVLFNQWIQNTDYEAIVQ